MGTLLDNRERPIRRTMGLLACRAKARTVRLGA
jgi:hypothetical protein